MSGFFFRFRIKAATAARHWPTTVATAAPITSSRGKPSRPKMRMGSRTMLVTAPRIWVHMDRWVRPVDWSSRSKVNWQNRPMEQHRHTRA